MPRTRHIKRRSDSFLTRKTAGIIPQIARHRTAGSWFRLYKTRLARIPGNEKVSMIDLQRATALGVAVAKVIEKKTNLRNKMIVRIIRFPSSMLVVGIVSAVYWLVKKRQLCFFAGCC